MRALIAFVGVLLFCVPAYGKFLPDNDLHLRMFSYEESNVSKKEFFQVIKEAEEYYNEIFAGHGATLTINGLWDNNTVNANATQYGDNWVVNMYGGLARAPEVTKDGFAMVLCHEIGHHLGGFPNSWSRWAANEGQSDYFGTLTCARQLWGDDDYSKVEVEIDDYPKKLCDAKFYGEGVSALNVCYRSMMAGWSLANLLSELGNDGEIFWDIPDDNEVTRTYNGHPDAQCRLDTYMAGALCEVDFNPSLIPGDEAGMARSSCYRALGDKDGVRPRCWFAPKDLSE